MPLGILNMPICNASLKNPTKYEDKNLNALLKESRENKGICEVKCNLSEKGIRVEEMLQMLYR